MVELETFERRVSAALRAYASEMPGRVDAVAVADRVAAERPVRGWRIGAWASGRLDRAWAAGMLVLLLLVVLAAAVFVGGWWPDRAVVVVSPTPTATTGDEGTILATTQAKPLPAPATCPFGTVPDALGPIDQERPGDRYAAMAFDRHAGRIVLLVGGDLGQGVPGTQTWTFDVCTNRWQQMSPAEEPTVPGSGSPGGALVYDADSDRTLAFADDIWSYDLAADRWTKVGSLPDGGSGTIYGTIFYHDPSGLVVAYDGVTMWAYDVDTGALSEVRQRPDPALPGGSGLPAGKIAYGYDARRDLVVAVVVPFAGLRDGATDPPVPAAWQVPTSEWGETWSFHPGTGAWHRQASAAPSDLVVCGADWYGTRECYPTRGRTVFDEASGRLVFINRDWGQQASPGRVMAYDAGMDAWRTLHPSLNADPTRVSWCTSMPPAYDPINGRIVCLGIYFTEVPGVTAFSTATNDWRWLLEPGPPARPER